jgi:hypothetical protein
MNAIKVNPKTVVLIPAKTAQVSEVTWRTSDDPFKQRLHIVVNDAAAFLIEGDDYGRLGQWTDDTMKQIVLERLGVQEM